MYIKFWFLDWFNDSVIFRAIFDYELLSIFKLRYKKYAFIFYKIFENINIFVFIFNNLFIYIICELLTYSTSYATIFLSTSVYKFKFTYLNK